MLKKFAHMLCVHFWVFNPVLPGMITARFPFRSGQLHVRYRYSERRLKLPENCLKSVLSTSDGELVAQVSWNRTSLLDALFCLEPYRNTMSSIDTSHVHPHDTPPSKALCRGCHKC